MSKVLNILVEGATEKEFVQNLIYPYLLQHGISNVRPITIETSPGFKGGDVRYLARYKPNVVRLLKGTEDMVVTSLIDYYKLRDDFPNYEESKKIPDVIKRVENIEKGCFEDIEDPRFIPYIQLHELEGLLFSNYKGFELFTDLSQDNRNQIKEIISKYPNPELINEGRETAPSKRLIKLIGNYHKVLHGNMIAMENGFDSMLNSCPRFKDWIETLIERMYS